MTQNKSLKRWKRMIWYDCMHIMDENKLSAKQLYKIREKLLNNILEDACCMRHGMQEFLNHHNQN